VISALGAVCIDDPIVHRGLVNQTLAVGDLSIGARAIWLFEFPPFHEAVCVDRNRGKEFLQGLALVVATISAIALGLALLRAFPLW
jgi:hypothetical protein